MEDQALAGAQKKATREGRIIIFIDESGISERPHRVSTWAPKGQTPVLQYSFNWKQLSAVAGVSFWNIYFKLVQGAVQAPEIVAFLKALRRHLGNRKLLIVWDRLQAHRSRLVREYDEGRGFHGSPRLLNRSVSQYPWALRAVQLCVEGRPKTPVVNPRPKSPDCKPLFAGDSAGRAEPL